VTVLDRVPSIPHGVVLDFSPKPVVEAAATKEIPCHAIPEESRDPLPVRIRLPLKEDLKIVLWVFLIIVMGSILAVFFF
jgi:hypothetical protein